MNIAQLIDWLSKYPPSMDVQVWSHDEQNYVDIEDETRPFRVLEVGPDENQPKEANHG